MKIDKTNPLQGAEQVQKQNNAQNAQKAGGVNFAEMLQKAALTPELQQISSIPSTGVPVTPATTLSPLFSLGVTDPQKNMADIRNQGVGMLENLLSSLEMYVNALKNDAIGKERLQPMLQQMMENKNGLLEMLAPLPADDPLKVLAQSTAMTLTQESINAQSY